MVARFQNLEHPASLYIFARAEDCAKTPDPIEEMMHEPAD